MKPQVGQVSSHLAPPPTHLRGERSIPGAEGGKDAAFAKEPFAALSASSTAAAATKLVPVSDRKGSSFRRLPLLHCEQSQQQSSKLYKKNISIISRGEGAGEREGGERQGEPSSTARTGSSSRRKGKQLRGQHGSRKPLDQQRRGDQRRQ